MQTAGNDTDIGAISVTYSTTIHSQTPKHDAETARNNTYRRYVQIQFLTTEIFHNLKCFKMFRTSELKHISYI